MLYQHTYWMFTEVWQSQTLTCLAMWSSITRDASTCVRIDSVRTSCSIHTRAAVAFVDIYKNNIKHVKIRKVNCINISVVQLHRISLRVIRDYTFLENDHAFEGEVNLSHTITPTEYIEIYRLNVRYLLLYIPRLCNIMYCLWRFENYNLSPVSQCVPMYPTMHAHVYELTASVQVAPSRHGLLLHSLMSTRTISHLVICEKIKA